MMNERNITQQNQQHQVVIVTGLSGAGKTSVIRALEDFGFYCVDNLPVPLLTTFVRFALATPSSLVKVAIGIDVRSEKFLKDFAAELSRLEGLLAAHNVRPPKIVFLSSHDQVISKRFQETRRKHPLGRGITLQQAIDKERDLLAPIKKIADTHLTTDTLNIHELRKWVRDTFSYQDRELVVNLVSFGFKYGVPTESNLLFDVRFLPNPYFDPELKAYSGQDQRIQKYLFSQNEVNQYFNHLETFLRYSLVKSFEEGRFFVTVAIGCTGGRHRSVALVEKLAQCSWEGITYTKHHRDIHLAESKTHESKLHKLISPSKTSSV